MTMLLRLIHLLILSSPVILVTLWFSDNPGVVDLEWLGWRIETNVPVLLVALLLVFAVLSGLEGLIAQAVGLPARLRALRRAKGHDQGLTLLISALKVAARGDAAEARRLAEEAAALLGAPELPERLAAVARGPGGEARVPVSRPAAPPREAEPPPRRGVWGRRAQAVIATPNPPPKPPPPPAPAVVAVPFDGTAFADQVKAGQWQAAVSLLDTAVTDGALAAAEAARLRAVVLAGEAAAVEAEDADKALALAGEALRVHPGFLPAALLAVRRHLAAGNKAEAEAVIGAAWRAAPARPLLGQLTELLAEVEPGPRLAEIQTLVQSHPDHIDSHLAIGGAAAAAENWGLARRHLVAASKLRSDEMACRLMAEIEEKDGGDTAAAEMWRRKAAAAEPPPAWRCGACAASAESWLPLCPACGAVATVEWSGE